MDKNKKEWSGQDGLDGIEITRWDEKKSDWTNE